MSCAVARVILRFARAAERQVAASCSFSSLLPEGTSLPEGPAARLRLPGEELVVMLAAKERGDDVYGVSGEEDGI